MTQRLLFPDDDLPPRGDPCANFHGGDPASRDAFEQQGEERRRAMRKEIWLTVRDCGATGATCDEVEARLGYSHQTASARLTELRADGLVVRTGQRRRTRSGASAHVVVAVT